MKILFNISYKNNWKVLCQCQKNTSNEIQVSNSSVRKTNQDRLKLLSNCGICYKKKSTFIKNQDLHNFNDISSY